MEGNMHYSPDTYSITFAKRTANAVVPWITVDFNIYDDDRDLVLFVRGEPAQVATALTAFSAANPLNPYQLNSISVKEYTPITFSANPATGELLKGIEAAIKKMEFSGFTVVHRSNNWS